MWDTVASLFIVMHFLWILLKKKKISLFGQSMAQEVEHLKIRVITFKHPKQMRVILSNAKITRDTCTAPQVYLYMYVYLQLSCQWKGNWADRVVCPLFKLKVINVNGLVQQQNYKCVACLCVSIRLSTEMLLSRSVMASMTSVIHSWPCSETANLRSAKTCSHSLTHTCRDGRWVQTHWLCLN